MKLIKPAIILFGLITIITGFIYPLMITALAQVLFPNQANGSLILRDNRVIGSELIGQQFDQPQYFWGRISATSGYPYNASASGGSNYSTLNPNLTEAAAKRIAALKAIDPENEQPIPVDLVTSSASGLDPHISIAAARYQARRVARERGISVESIQTLINQHTESTQFDLLGEARVNVLVLNLALDGVK